MTPFPQRFIRTGSCWLSMLLASLALRAQSPTATSPLAEWRIGFNRHLDDEMKALVSARTCEVISPTPKGLDGPTSLSRRGNLNFGLKFNASQPLPSSIGAMLHSQGLPTDLMAVVAVESDFNPAAVSPKGAAGLWQFMPATARQYGLVINAARDDRFDVVKSTIAAARYLRELRGQFGGWPLALAAYNAGPNRVLKEMRRLKVGDFLMLNRNSSLPGQTVAYVQKVLDIMTSGVTEVGVETPSNTDSVSLHEAQGHDFVGRYRKGNIVFATGSPDRESPQAPKEIDVTGEALDRESDVGDQVRVLPLDKVQHHTRCDLSIPMHSSNFVGDSSCGAPYFAFNEASSLSVPTMKKFSGSDCERKQNSR